MIWSFDINFPIHTSFQHVLIFNQDNVTVIFSNVFAYFAYSMYGESFAGVKWHTFWSIILFYSLFSSTSCAFGFFYALNNGWRWCWHFCRAPSNRSYQLEGCSQQCWGEFSWDTLDILLKKGGGRGWNKTLSAAGSDMKSILLPTNAHRRKGPFSPL